MTRFIMADSCSQLVFYVPVGLLLFALPFVHTLRPQTLTGYVLTTLYMIGPLGTLMNASRSLAGRSWRWAESRDLGSVASRLHHGGERRAHPATIRSWERLDLQDSVG